MTSSPAVRPTAPRADCPVQDYARRVAAGEVPACRWVRKACERHLRDLQTGHGRGLWWDQAAADFAVGFARRVRHTKGRQWAGRLFRPEPWQEFVLGCLFGWKRADGTRRFRVAYVEVPRKNGKTFLAAIVALILLAADGEPGAEVYAAATKRDQAKLSFNQAARIVAKSPSLKKLIRRYRESLQLRDGDGSFQPVSSEAHTLDGLNPSGVIADEIHKWPTRELWDVLDTATGARAQPLMLAITTAGDLEDSIYAELRAYLESVVNGTVEDDSFLGYLATIDEGDDPLAESSWQKANPNWGVTVSAETLREKLKRMGRTRAGLNRFKRDYLCVRTEVLNAWIPLDAWDKCRADFEPDDLAGQPCFGGLDIASTADLVAFSRVWPTYAGGLTRYRVRVQFWCPADAHDSVGERLRETLRPWVEAGHVVEATGAMIDQREIKAAVLAAAAAGQLLEVAFDPHNARQLAGELLEAGVQMFEFHQGMASYNEPAKEFEAAVRSGRLAHDGNPVLRWMVGNCVSVEDGIGRVMPHRRKSRSKIDGIPATIMAIARAMRGEPKPAGGGVEAW